MRESNLRSEGGRARRRVRVTLLCGLAIVGAGTAATASAAPSALIPPPIKVSGPIPVPSLPVPSTPVPPSPIPGPVPGTSPTSPAQTVQSLGSTTATLISSDSVIRIAPSTSASSRPGVSLGLAVARISGRSSTGTRYVLKARDVQCTGAANRVLVTVGGARRTAACRSGASVVSPALHMARIYTVTVQAVQMHGHTEAAGGAQYVGTIRVVAVRRGSAIMAGG